MQLDKSPKTTTRKSKRVGRGYGSGKGGHTSGRGSKGQKAREKVAINFEGTKFKKSFIKRLPLLRGRGKLKPWGSKFRPVNLDRLADWPEKTPVTEENLLKLGINSKPSRLPTKILGGGNIKKPLDVRVATSASAAEKITKAGGKIWKNS